MYLFTLRAKRVNLKRTKAVAKKEFYHLVRDYRMLSILLFFPVFLLIIFGYAVNFDVKDIKLSIYDNDRSILSRRFINSITSSGYFVIESYLTNSDDIDNTISLKKAQSVLFIPKDFSSEYYSNRESKIQFIIDGVDGNTANIIQSYANLVTNEFNNKISSELLLVKGKKQYIPLDVRSIFWYNPDLKSTKFLIPGLIAMILLITATITVSLTLVREKERGTIEQINVSPLSSIEVLIGKTAPYLTLGFLNSIFILIAGYLVFDVEVKGSLILLFISIFVFLIAATSIGIFISVLVDTQQVAFTIATFVSLLPSVILSGFIFPIESMPIIVQAITNITPAKFFIEILRGIVLRGVGISAFWDQFLYLLIFIFLLLTVSIVLNKRKSIDT